MQPPGPAGRPVAGRPGRAYGASMWRPGRGGRLLAALLACGITLIAVAGTAVAAPARPTVDPSAPTPTAPWPGQPPQGEAPDGSTVGGEELDTRGTVVAEGTPPLPDGLAAAGWLVADAGSGDVLAARDPHGRYYPASTLKTLTLLTLASRLDPAQVVAGTAEDENIEGSRVGLVARRPVPGLAALPGADAPVRERRRQRPGPGGRRGGGDRRGDERDRRGDRGLRHGRRDAVGARRRRAVVLALRPRADLPGAGRGPGHRGDPHHRRRRRCPRSTAAPPATRSRTRTRS